MNTNNKTVFFFCSNYSISFVQTEIENLARKFKHVVIISDSLYAEIKLPNVSVNVVEKTADGLLLLCFKNFRTISYTLFSELFSSKVYILNLGSVKKVIGEMLDILRYKQSVLTLIKGNEMDAFFYSFWFNKWASLLSIFKLNNIIKHYTVRVHGADLFEERVPVIKKLSFRKFQLKFVDEVFSVSKVGENYLKKKYPTYSSKVFTSYLGTSEFGINPFRKENVFTVVSCARVRNIKRIHVLAEMIASIDFEVKWIHIGDENEKSTDPTVKQYFLMKNKIGSNPKVNFCPMGELSNKEVINLYKSVSINLFVSVSETEGLPVSMMEAISFGIPILATDVGGCKEIVNENTGLLINKDFNHQEFINALKGFKNSNMNTENFRTKARKFWSNNFNVHVNFENFLNSIDN